jgi:hypothetical protein
MTKAANLSALGSTVTTAGNISSESTLTLQTNSTTALTINSSQQVGIGTSSPSFRLDVNGLTRFRFSSGTGAGTWLDTLGNAQRYFVGTDAVTESWRIYDSVAAAQRVLLDSAGNVGIGTASPAVRLHVNSGATDEVARFEGTGTPYISLYDSGTRDFYIVDDTGTISIWGQANKDMAFATNNTEKMRITSTGNVSIGTASTSSKLEVYGSVVNTMSNAGTEDAATVTITNSDVSGLGRIAKTLYEIGNLPIASVSGVYTTFNATNDIGGALAFSTQSTAAGGVLERMRVNKDGNVGIGTTSPGAKLDVRGSVILGNPATGEAVYIKSAVNWNYSELEIIRNASNVAQPRFIGMSLDGDNLTSTTVGEYNAIWGLYDSAPTTGSTSSALNSRMMYGAYAGHIWVTNGTERMRIDASGIVTGTAGNLMLISGTSQATTSGTFIDFTGIPSWVKKITVMFSGVSTNGTSILLIQIGDSGGVENTGYLGASSFFSNSGVGTNNSTTGVQLPNGGEAITNLRHGHIVISNLTGNTWTFSGSIGLSDLTRSCVVSYSKSLSAVLDRVRITTVNGTDTFDAGSVNILYE